MAYRPLSVPCHGGGLPPLATFGYKDLIPRIKAEKFDPNDWAELLAKSGAKFAEPVALHHDNFAMWDSAVTR